MSASSVFSQNTPKDLWSYQTLDGIKAFISGYGFNIKAVHNSVPTELQNQTIYTTNAQYGPNPAQSYSPQLTATVTDKGIIFDDKFGKELTSEGMVYVLLGDYLSMPCAMYLGTSSWFYVVTEKTEILPPQLLVFRPSFTDKSMTMIAKFTISNIEKKISIGDSWGEVIDIDGNKYKTLRIGNKTWMIENLKTTRFANGDPIPTKTKGLDKIIKEKTPVYQWPPNGDENNVAEFGRLYTGWAVASPSKLCPEGWHVSTDEEWDELIKSLGGDQVAGGKLKKVALKSWDILDYATDEAGFKAVGAGELNILFSHFKTAAHFWTDKGMNTTHINSSAPRIYFYKYNKTSGSYAGRSVRCVKD